MTTVILPLSVPCAGEGGNDLLGNRRQLVDQKMSKGNLGMILAYERGTPVRVLRKNPDPDSDYKQVRGWGQGGGTAGGCAARGCAACLPDMM